MYIHTLNSNQCGSDWLLIFWLEEIGETHNQGVLEQIYPEGPRCFDFLLRFCKVDFWLILISNTDSR